MLANDRPVSDHAEPKNEAWEFLKKACAWFSPVPSEAEMLCPFCSCNTVDSWQKFAVTTAPDGKPLSEPSDSFRIYPRIGRGVFVKLLWLQCQNSQCRQIVVLVRRNAYDTDSVPPAQVELRSDMWFAVPQKRSPRQIDPLVKDPFKQDYIEASLILDDSPRMSAVLARKILADLLEGYGKVTRSLKLSTMIEAFEKQGGHPSHVTGNLDYLREIADFSAHTQKDELGNIVDVEPKEAEWTLEVVDTLFDYFIVGPEKDKERRAKFDKKIEQAGRKPIKK